MIPTVECTMSSPLVSVVIPTKDRCALLRETLASLQAQDYSNWEAVVIDDHSGDDTLICLADLQKQDGRIRFFSRQGDLCGAPVCRNQGIAHARGAYVVFLDSDDLLAPWCLQQRVEIMEDNSHLDFAVFQAGLFTTAPTDSSCCWNAFTDQSDMERFLSLDGVWGPCGPMWRRPALDMVGPWDEILPRWQDWDFHLRALFAKCTYAKFNIVDCYIRLMSEDRQTIGNSPHRDTTFAWVKHLVDKFEGLLESWPEKPEEIDNRLVGLRYWYFQRLAAAHLIEARAGWSQFRDHESVSSWIYWSGRTNLSAQQNRFTRVALQWLIRRTWPSSLYTSFGSSTFLQGAMPAVEE